MAGIARLNDTIAGSFSGEHGGHYAPITGAPIHPSGSISGTVSGGCSSKVFIKGVPIALQGSTTSEQDACTNGSGAVSGGSSKIFENGTPVARLNDAVTPHTTGDAHITSASSKVLEG